MSEYKIDIVVRTVKYGKKETVITLPGVKGEQLKETLRYLKKRLGTGGYIEDGKIVLKGDMTRRILKLLVEELASAVEAVEGA